MVGTSSIVHSPFDFIPRASLPGATSDYIDKIIKVRATGVEDKFYLGILDASGNPAWKQLTLT
ncbi:MAG: hypothetical protein K0S80_3851 [Neobacillus sp.]|nr:hypothetical protein [Neobacillus sp.]